LAWGPTTSPSGASFGHGVSGPLCDVGPATDELDGRPRLALPSRGGAVPRVPRRAGPCLCPARRASVFAWAPEIPAADERREPGARTEQNGPTHGCESMLGRDDCAGSSLARASEVLRWTTAFAPDRAVSARWRIAASHSSQAMMLAPWRSVHVTGCSSRVSNQRPEGPLLSLRVVSRTRRLRRARRRDPCFPGRTGWR
jgi:hypothetical protein